MKTGEKIRVLRGNHGMTQRQLAEVLNVSESAVQKWESCRNEVPAAALGDIREVFGVSFDSLMDESKEVVRLIRLGDMVVEGETHEVFDADLPGFATVHRFDNPANRPFSAVYVGPDEMLSVSRAREAEMVSYWRKMHYVYDEINLERVSPEERMRTRAYDDDGIVEALIRLLEVLDELFLEDEREAATRAKQAKGLVTFTASDLLAEDMGDYWGKTGILREHMGGIAPELARRMEAAMYSGRTLAGYSRNRWGELDVVVDAKAEFDYVYAMDAEGERMFDGITGKSPRVVAQYVSNYLYAFHGVRRIDGCSLLGF